MNTPAPTGQGGNQGNKGRDGGGRDGGRGGRERDGENEGFQDRVVHIARVAKVVKGGRRFSFSALIVVGDGKGHVGFGLGKANEVPDAIKKGGDQARKNLLSVPIAEGTIPFNVIGKFGSCRVVMLPAPRGKGIIAGGAVRTLVELAGISDIVCKAHGTKNPANVVRAAANGLSQLLHAEAYAKGRGKTAADVIQVRASAKTEKDAKKAAAPAKKSK